MGEVNTSQGERGDFRRGTSEENQSSSNEGGMWTQIQLKADVNLRTNKIGKRVTEVNNEGHSAHYIQINNVKSTIGLFTTTIDRWLENYNNKNKAFTKDFEINWATNNVH